MIKLTAIRLAGISLVVTLCMPMAWAQQAHESMGFFITSQGLGEGGNLGGLEGADAHCQHLAAAVGSGKKQWRAYLSADGVNARGRIGKGPWHNAKGVQIAATVAALHGSNNITKDTALNERGQIIKGRGDSPNRHDILTGSNADGTATDNTCNNWTSGGFVGAARVGHHDRTGGGSDPSSWNSAHNSRGCTQHNLKSSGGDGLFYCFAAD